MGISELSVDELYNIGLALAHYQLLCDMDVNVALGKGFIAGAKLFNERSIIAGNLRKKFDMALSSKLQEEA